MVHNPQHVSVRRAGLTAAAVTAAVCGMVGAGFVAPASATTTDLHGVIINEVESNNDATDWIELYNTTGAPIDLSDGFLADSDDDHAFPLSGTIAAGGYAVFDVSEGDDGFGLGAQDSARLFQGEDVATGTPINAFEWDEHAATTYGRDTDFDDDGDGLGDWKVTDHATRGAENVFPGSGSIGDITGVRINEVESDADDVHGDWVELKNTSTAAIDITGAIVSDDSDSHQFTVPTTAPLAAGALAAFRLDSGATGFGLGAADKIRLFQPGDTLLENQVDSEQWSVHAVETYGLDSSNVWRPTSGGTFGTANTFATSTADPLTGVVISEVKTTGDATNGDWIELHNTSGASVDLTNAILADNNDAHAMRISGSLAAGAYKGFRVDDPDVQGNFGLGDEDHARLFKSDVVDLTSATAISEQAWTTHAHTSWGFASDGATGVETHKPTINAANDFTSTVTPDTSWVVLNEVDSDATVGDGEDYIELKNTASVSLNIGGMLLSDSENKHHYAIPAGTNLAAGAVYLVEIDNVTGGFGLGSEDAARLFAAGTTITGTEIDENAIPLDHQEWTEHPTGSWTRSAGGLGEWTEATPTPGA